MEISMVLSKMKFRYLAAFLSAIPGATDAQESMLSASDCEFIERYNQMNEYSFQSDFSYMIHYGGNVGGCVDCFVPLSRRTQDVEVSVVLVEDPALYDPISFGISRFVNLVQSETTVEVEILPIGSPNLHDGGTIVFFVVSSGNILTLQELFGSDPTFSSFLDEFEAGLAECGTVFFDWTEASEASYVFVSTIDDSSPEHIASCVMEEAYSAMGLAANPQGETGLFADIRWRGESIGGRGYWDYGLRDQLFMRLLYREEFQAGQSLSETQTKIREIVDGECSQ